MITEVECGFCKWEFTVLDRGTTDTVRCPACNEPVEVPRLEVESRNESM